MASVDYMLTTTDNPYNPFTHFEDWYKFDMINGYNTCGYLANSCFISDKFGDAVNDEETYRAMNEIVEREPMIYKIVSNSK